LIRRNIADKLQGLSRTFPVVTVTGPRQSGKTTLCRQVFSGYDYLSMERPDIREHASNDPLDLLERHGDRVILDEIQRVPELLSYLQTEVDRDRRPGRFVLTGSHNLLLISGVSQTLAGRTAILNLLPFSRDEIERFSEYAGSLEPTLWTGSYPPIFDEGHEPGDWLAAYVSTYVERDVRQILEIRDLRAFQLFMRLCAARTGQVLNMGSLAADAGISAGTVRSWLGLLEASFLITLLPGWYANPRKRLIKSPKLHFIDTGLCCWLLGIRSASDLVLHHARGAIFESWVVSEVLKSRLNRGLPPALHHVRNQKGEEIDLLVDDGLRKSLVEVKSGRTITSEAFRGLKRWESLLGAGDSAMEISRFLVYGGTSASRRADIDVMPWTELAKNEW
jgi:uncharacterized protein